MNQNINISNESFNAGLKDLHTSTNDTIKASSKLTGSFNAGLKDLKKVVIKQNQSSVTKNVGNNTK